MQEVNTAINQMDQVTQQNAAMVEESTAASRTLTQEAEALSLLINRFKIEEQPKAERSRAKRSPSRPVARPVSAPAMKTMGRGGAAPKPAEASWEEF